MLFVACAVGLAEAWPPDERNRLLIVHRHATKIREYLGAAIGSGCVRALRVHIDQAI